MTTDAAMKKLAEFTAGRRGWHLHAPDQGVSYGWRDTEILGTAFQLRVYPSALADRDPAHEAGKDVWCANAVSSDQQVARYVGTYDEVTEEIARTERTFDLVAELQACTTRSAAEQLVDTLRGQQLELLRMVFDLPRGPAQRTRHRIVQRACGSRLDAAILSDHTKWS